MLKRPYGLNGPVDPMNCNELFLSPFLVNCALMSFVEVNCNEITLDLDDESNRTYLGEKFMDDENTQFSD